jgi:hypothetical protein
VDAFAEHSSILWENKKNNANASHQREDIAKAGGMMGSQ